MTRLLNQIKSFIRFSIPIFLDHPLWEGRRHLPFLRFLRLQIIFALGETNICLPWFTGLWLPICKGDSGLTGNYYLGLHEFRDMAFTAQLLKPGDLFVDIGANLGSYSLIASGLCKAQSIAFEPAPPAYEKLQKTIKANCLCDLISPRPYALSSPSKYAASDALWFSTDRDTINSFVDHTYYGKKQHVPITTLDVQLEALHPTLIKIDVEGFEYDVLKGASSSLASDSCLAIIIEGQTAEISTLLANAGFEDVGYDAFSRSIQELPVQLTSNKIWIKVAKRHQIQERLSSAPTSEIYGCSF